MLLKTKNFQEACKTIALAVDGNAANLELVTKNNFLYLNVTNREYFTSIKFELENAEDFHTTVDASLFLNLISGITTDTFDLTIKGTTTTVKAGKSSYKLAMIYENDNLMSLPVISINNKTIEMPIELDILKSVINVNSKELLKAKNVDNITEIQKLYYVTNEGCFTFTTGACLNKFTLEKPVQILLNDRIVKLFKLFKSDVKFSLGHDQLPNGMIQTKVIFETDDTYLAAIITNDKVLLDKVQGPCMATKSWIEAKYSNSLVLSTAALSGAISRLMLFRKNSLDKVNMASVPVKVVINNTDMNIIDSLGNNEVITIENGSYVDSEYEMGINLFDLKLILDGCKEDHLTMNCGNHRSVILTRNNIYNLIPEI